MREPIVSNPVRSALVRRVLVRRVLARSAFASSALALVLAASAALAQDEGGGEGEAPALSVSGIVLSKGLEDGDPVDPGTSFSQSDGQIYATVRVQNPSRQATSIKVVMRPTTATNGGHGIELEIPARVRWKTVARFTTRREPESYQVIVFDPDGEELSSTSVSITE